MRRKGFSIGSVLLLAMVVVLVSVSIAALAGFQLSSAQQAEKSRDAEYLAESAINEVVSNLTTAGPTYGTAGQSLTFQPDPADGLRTGTVTFVVGVTPYSTNNLAGTTANAIGFGGAAVPPGCVRVIGIGHSSNTVREVEAMITSPLYPYAMSWGGTLTVDNLFVNGAASLLNFTTSGGNPTPLTVPASIMFTGANALAPANNVSVSGNIYFGPGGSVALNPGSTVGGQVRQVTNLVLPAPPAIATILAPIPAALVAGVPVQSAVLPASPASGNIGLSADPGPLPGYIFTNAMLSIVGGLGPGSLTVTGGDLVLNNSVVYVNGPVTVTGGNIVLNHSMLYVSGGGVTCGETIKGSGAVIATGAVSLQGLSAVDPSTEVAILAQGNISILAGVGPSFYQGLLYTAGNLTINGSLANPITVAGAMVAAGNITMTGTTVWGIPQCSALCYSTGFPSAANPPAFGTTLPAYAAAAPPTPFVALNVATSNPAGSGLGASAAVQGAVPGPLTGAYLAQMGAGPAPLASATTGAETLNIGGVNYDANINRYITLQPPLIQCPAGSTRSTFDAGVAPFFSQDIIAQYMTAQGLAAVNANSVIIPNENLVVTTGPIQAPVVFTPATLGTSVLQINLDLRQFINGGTPSYAVVALRNL